MKSFIAKIGAGRLFLILVVVVYVVVGIADSESALAALSAFWKLFKGIIPVLAVVYLMLFLSGLFITSKLVLKYMGEGKRRSGWLISIVSGIISSGPIYLWYPLLSDLKEKGMRESYIACFLYNRAVKIPLLPMMILYFGIRFTTVLTAIMIVFSVLNGYFVERFSLRAAGTKEHE